MFLYAFVACSNLQAQNYQLIHHYDSQSGLPSNKIYEIQQDTFGHLWLATDNGMSRFDGKYFRNYSFKDGLPGQDIVALRVDCYGRLWVNCFGYKPTYYEDDAFHVIKDTAIKNSNYKLLSSLENEVDYNDGGNSFSLLINRDKHCRKIKNRNTLIKGEWNWGRTYPQLPFVKIDM